MRKGFVNLSIAIVTEKVKTKVKRNGNWIETFTGTKFYPLDAKETEIEITDIAHSLSNQCRYGGHTSGFYSVAQHSCLVADLVDSKYKLDALLHDATEAYLLDLPKPVKMCMPDYEKFEEELREIICRKFNIVYPIPKNVLDMDTVAACIEHENFFSDKFKGFYQTYTSLPIPKIKLDTKTPVQAKKLFLNMYYFLEEKRGTHD